MTSLLVKVKKIPSRTNFFPPQYMTDGASGLDLFAAIDSPIELRVLERKLIPCGFSMEIPPGYEAQIRPRSGLAIRHGLTCLNSPGTIDSDYRGEVQVILINLGEKTFQIMPGDRIAQMVIHSTLRASLAITTEDLSPSLRNEGGFGSTGSSLI